MAAGRPDPTRTIASLAEQARAGLSDVGREWRRFNRFRRIRIGVVAGWAVVSLVAMWAACPVSGPSNALGADVHVLKDSLVGGEQLLVRNESTSIWTDVELTLDDEWKHEQRTMRPHDQVVLSMSQFRRGTETAARDFKPKALLIRCQQGRATFDLR